MKLGILSIGAVVLVGIAFARTQSPAKPAQTPAQPAHTPAKPEPQGDDRVAVLSKAVCVLEPRSGSTVRGIVRFTTVPGGVSIEASVSGLTPGAHGFHVHEWGDLECSDGKCTGNHFNPTGANHGSADAPVRHVGDLGNLEANAEGVATYQRVDSQLKLIGPHSIVGRGLIVHADPDDFKTQPTGNAGARVAAGVIGIADPSK